jgi:uncharacterized protein (TIGR03067 family)
MSRWLLSSCIAVLITSFASGVHAQDEASALAPLQGRWVVTGGEHNGKPMDSIKGGVMTIAGSAFEVRTASGNMLKGTLRVNNSTRPFQLDMLHADGAKWEAIYAIEGDVFRLNYVDAGGKDPRPAAFTTSEKTEESIVHMRRDRR